MATVRFTGGRELTPDEREARRQRMAEAAKHPIVFDEDSPELTDEQLAEFRPVHFATWEERAEYMRKMGITNPEIEEQSPAKMPVETAAR